jgi:autotransporter translocation and assembly factor TamB
LGRRLKILLLATALLLPAGLGGCGLLPEKLWNWGGPQLLDLARDRINGRITAREISGNPFTGLTFQDLVVSDPKGQVVLRAERLELRFSLQSLTALCPIIARVALVNPHFYLVEEAGTWNHSRLARAPGEAPAQAPGAITRFFLREIDISRVLVEQGVIDLTRDGASQRYTDLDLDAAVSLSNVAAANRKIDLRHADLKLTAPQGRLELATGFTYAADLVDIHSLLLKLAGKPVLSLKGEICRPLEEITCKLTGQLGPLQGETIRSFWPRWPAPWNLGGKFSFGSSPQGMELSGSGDLGQATFEMKGKLDATAKPAVFELNLDLKGLATGQLEGIKGLEAGKIQGLSTLNGRLRLQGQGLPWSPRELKAELKLEPFQYREVKVKALDLTLTGDAERQTLNARAEGSFGALALEFRGRLLPLGKAAPGAFGDLTVKMTEFQPAMLGLGKYPGTVLTGGFTGEFRLPSGYNLTQARLSGKLEARGKFSGQALEELKSQFTLEERKLHLREARVRLAAVTATLSGEIATSGLDLKFAAEVAGSQGLPVASPAAFAFLQAEGTVKGPWKTPQFSLSGKGRRLSVQGAILETVSFSANLTGWPPQSGSLQLQGDRLHTPAGDFSRLTLGARGEEGRWGLQMAATSPKHPQFRLTGTADLRERPLTVAVNLLSWQGQTLTLKNRAPFTVRLLPGWEIAPAAFQVDGGLVTVQALVRGDEVSGKLEIQGLDASLLSPSDLQAQGKVNAKLTLAGSPRAPVLHGSLSLVSGRIKDIPIQTLTATLGYEDERLEVSGYLEEGLNRSRLTWKGAVPASLSLLPPKFVLGRQDLYLRVQSDRVNLSLLPLLIREVQSAQGPLDLLLELRGDPYHPLLSGFLRWSEGTLQLRKTGASYQLTPGEIRLLGDKVTIPGIVLISDGTFRLAGDLSLTAAPTTRLKAELNNFLLLNRGGNEIWGSGYVDLAGPLNALVATGRLTVPKAQFRPTFFRSPQDPDIVLVQHKPPPEAGPAPEIYRNLRVDVPLESTGNVFLKDPVGQVEMKGNLRATKSPGGKLVVGGTIEALKGTVDVQEREFKVERAVLTLPGVAGQPALVDGKAVHPMDDITLVFIVTGTVTNPQMRLESEPPLPPSDVLSYLVFGAPTASLTRDQFYALGAQTLGVLGGITSKKISEILGSSVPFLGGGVAVKSGTAAGRATLGVEKKITQNVSVSYQRNFNEERGQYERQVVIDYKINKNFSVESQLGTRNSGADVLFNYDF